jgi:histidine triad (HIT) family protein
MVEQAECIFCRIARGEIPADIVYEDEQSLAFRDIQPAAPTHVLVIPREHIASLHALTAEQRDVAAALFMTAQRVADLEGVAEQGYRVVTNIGEWGGQSVAHLHLHVLGGRQLRALG